MVEIVGQFEQHGLLDPATHGEMLDAHGGHDSPAVAAAWRLWQTKQEARAAAQAEIAAAKRDEEFLRHAADELSGLVPQPGEEAGLAEQRSLMLHRSKLVEAMQTALDELSGERAAAGTALGYQQGGGGNHGKSGDRDLPGKRHQRLPADCRGSRCLQHDHAGLATSATCNASATRSTPTTSARSWTSSSASGPIVECATL